MSFLIVDHHSKDQRVEDLKVLLSEVDSSRGVRHIAQLEGGDALVEPLLANVTDTVGRNVQGSDLILLHCGPDQHLLPEALAVFPRIPCLLYSGGSVPRKIERFFQNAESSSFHAVIFETLKLAGLTEKQKSCLKGCVRLILDTPGPVPRKAVQETFGDPVLEAKLDRLYDALRSGTSIKDLSELRKELLDKEPWE